LTSWYCLPLTVRVVSVVTEEGEVTTYLFHGSFSHKACDLSHERSPCEIIPSMRFIDVVVFISVVVVVVVVAVVVVVVVDRTSKQTD